jgi:hypothetical protein
MPQRRLRALISWAKFERPPAPLRIGPASAKAGDGASRRARVRPGRARWFRTPGCGGSILRLAVECDGDEWHGPERYEQDLARQRDLERAGWQFVRIRGGDFYCERERSTAQLWAELDRLGIKPGGIDQAAAEPPLPADSERMERREVDEIIPLAPRPVGIGTDASPAELAQDSGHREPDLADEESGSAPADIIRSRNSFLGDYVSYHDQAGPDPRTVSVGSGRDCKASSGGARSRYSSIPRDPRQLRPGRRKGTGLCRGRGIAGVVERGGLEKAGVARASVTRRWGQI